MSNHAHRVVIIGGGFGGLNVALGLRRAAVEVQLIDRRNFHLFQPLLYQVATGALSPANIATPLRAILKRFGNTRVLLGEVTDVDVAGRRVILADGEVPYDTLVVATGATHAYFGHPEWEGAAPGLKSIEDATEIRRRVLMAFESAERAADDAAVGPYLTFVVVGAGPTGVEMAGAVAELARQTLPGNFRRIDPARARILLIEGADRVLPPFKPKLSDKASQSLRRMGVEIWTGAIVTAIRPGEVMVRRGSANEVVTTRTIVWAAGVAASPLGHAIGRQTGATIDRQGRVMVGPELTVTDHPELFVIGDLAAVPHAAVTQQASVAAVEGGKPPPPPTLPGVAPVAIQEGKYVAKLIRRRLDGKPDVPFVYRDKGSMATIGRASAVADLGWLQLSGYPAWLAWLCIHLMYLVQFQSRVLVLVQWAWNYVTRNRAARLITGGPESVVMAAPDS